MKLIQSLTILLATGLLLNSCNSEKKEKSGPETKVEEVSLGAPVSSATDPVCKMKVDAKGEDSTIYEGKNYHFCSATCKGDFDANPKSYATK